MEYTINPKTGGICTLHEFLRHGCEKCFKKELCEQVSEMSENNELSISKENELSYNEIQDKSQKIKIPK